MQAVHAGGWGQPTAALQQPPCVVSARCRRCIAARSFAILARGPHTHAAQLPAGQHTPHSFVHSTRRCTAAAAAAGRQPACRAAAAGAQPLPTETAAAAAVVLGPLARERRGQRGEHGAATSVPAAALLLPADFGPRARSARARAGASCCVQRSPMRAVAPPMLRCRTATSSMTSVPKPLKFLRPHYDTLKAQLEGLPAGAPSREPLADVVRRGGRRAWQQWGPAAEVLHGWMGCCCWCCTAAAAQRGKGCA